MIDIREILKIELSDSTSKKLGAMFNAETIGELDWIVSYLDCLELLATEDIDFSNIVCLFSNNKFNPETVKSTLSLLRWLQTWKKQ